MSRVELSRVNFEFEFEFELEKPYWRSSELRNRGQLTECSRLATIGQIVDLRKVRLANIAVWPALGRVDQLVVLVVAFLVETFAAKFAFPAVGAEAN